MAFTYEYARPALTVDVVLFRRGEWGRVEVLLIERGRDPFKGAWALPGGFANPGEALDVAAARELTEETGVAGEPLRATGLLRQLGTFGEPGRDPRGWIVSVAYVAFPAVPVETPCAGDDAAAARWVPLVEMGMLTLAFDHAAIVAAARVVCGV